MPCGDITESLELKLDANEGIRSFSLAKRTCGAPVGNALLIEWIDGHTPEQVLSQSLAELVPSLHDGRTLDQFLLHKQFHAVCAALSVYLGREPGGLADPFTVTSISSEPEGTTIKGDIDVDVLAENVRACATCGCAKATA